ncbi:MAG: hypothetical protein AAF674_01605 [Pseudomonadota bacterium]
MFSVVGLPRLGAVMALTLGIGCGYGQADSLSPIQPVPTGGTGLITGSVGVLAERRAVLGWDAFAERQSSGSDSKRGIIDLAGPFGVVMDYTSGVPRFRGLSLSSGDSFRLEASGRVDSDFDEITGQLSVQFRF